MADTFGERTGVLSEMVGEGDLVGQFRVNGGERTIPLEVGYWLNYRGTEGYKKIRNYNDGGPHFVGGAIAENHSKYLTRIAESVLDGTVREAMIESMQDMTSELERRAPVRSGSLRQSGAEFVTDDGSPIHESFGPFYGQEPPDR